MNRVVLAVVVLFSFLTAAPQAQGQTVARFLSENGSFLGDGNYLDHDILRKAVATAGLTSALQNNSADFTLFAPNDLAFVVLARDLGYDGFDERGAFNHIASVLSDLNNGDPIPLLQQILLYHVAGEELDVVDVIFADEVVTLQGDSFRVKDFVRLADKEKQLTDPRLFFPLNIQYSNGIVHGINRVLMPFDLDL